MNYKKNELIAGNISDVNNKREKFVKEYAYSKGWDINNLTNEQLQEIKSQEGYKNPGMLLS